MSVYGEVLVPLIADDNSLPLVETFDVSLAGRYEDYSDFGSTFNPKIGLHWALSESLRVRASYSEAFRAPTLFNVNGRRSVFVVQFPNAFFTAFPEITSDPAGQTVLVATLGSNETLQEETADTWSVGLEFESDFAPGLMLSVTYFLYDYEDKIEDLSLFDIAQDPAFSEFAIVNPDPSLAASLIEIGGMPPNLLNLGGGFGPADVTFIAPGGSNNVAGRKVEGLDFTIGYERDTEFGLFSSSFNAAYLLNFETQASESSPSVDQLNIIYRPVDLRLRTNFSWTQKAFTGAAAINYTAGYEDNPDSSIANDIDSWTTVDLAFSYNAEDQFESALLNGVSLSLSLTNVFDADPPFVETPFGLNFDTVNANPFGRQFAISLTKRF